MGKHQDAANLDRKVLREDLTHKRMWLISNALYEIGWNEMEQENQIKRRSNKEKMTEILNQCAILSHFYGQTVYEDFYKDKLYQL